MNKSQNTVILDYLKKKGNALTPMKALKLFRCWSLSSRISNLKAMGYQIKSEFVTDKKTGKTYSKYSIE